MVVMHFQYYSSKGFPVFVHNLSDNGVNCNVLIELDLLP